MPIVTYILRDGERRSIDVTAGTSVMEAAIHNNVRGIDAECGGCCSCATCHIYVEDAFMDRLPPPDDMEHELLDGVSSDRLPGSRLGCQIVITPALEGLIVRIPESQV